MVFKSHAGNAVLVDLVKSDFLALADTPENYTDQAKMALVVNTGEDALEFGYTLVRLQSVPDTPANGDMWLV